MIITPFKNHPKTPRIALVSDDGEYVDENGNHFTDDSGYKFKLGEIVCYVLWDTAVSLIKRGNGEILRWNNTEIRWRATKYLEEEDWKPRALDAGIIRFPVTINTSFEDILKQLVEFRDWICGEGARPYCSLGSTSISLLRAKTTKEIITGRGAAPPIGYTRGGRVLMGREGTGKYEGQIYHWDLPAAYASTIGSICYDGIWTVRPYNSAIKAHEHGAPVYCHASVDIPSVGFGPLPEYISRPDNPIESAFRNALGYPEEKRIEGIWIFSELEEAEQIGCTITPIQCWVNLTARQPFLPWWNAIERGRELQGNLSRFLAKRTGNALWGMFASDQQAASSKVAIHYENGKRKTRRLDFRPNKQPPGHDFAEAISGSVRAKLYRHLLAANDQLLCAHTDGVWVQGKYEIPDGWKVKIEARRIDLIDPQTMRYYLGANDYHIIMSGIPPKLAADKFEERWTRIQRNRAGGSNVPRLQKGRRIKGRL